MEIGMNFIELFDKDVALSVLKFLDEPVDLIRISAVSPSWNNFVISNGLCKKLCQRKVPAISYIARVVERNRRTTELVDVTSRNSVSWGALKREHQIYASLLGALTSSTAFTRNCVACAIGASSTDRYPEHSIMQTLFAHGEHPWGGSHWSSMGQTDPTVTEFVLFKLISTISVVTSIHIRPHEVYWELGSPVYSAKFVRFRLGHPKAKADFGIDIWSSLLQRPASNKFIDNYVWTYTSPEFPMKQEYSLQEFKLPQPAFCVGGFLLIELLGLRQSEIDELFYVRLGYISISGVPLQPAFNLEMEASGELVLDCNPEILDPVMRDEYVDMENVPDIEDTGYTCYTSMVSGLLSDEDDAPFPF